MASLFLSLTCLELYSTVTGLQGNKGTSGYKAFLSEIETQPHFVEEVPFQNEG